MSSSPEEFKRRAEVALRDMVCGGLGSVRFTAGLDDRRCLFQPK